MSTKFFVCKHCGNIAKKVVDSGVPLVCCGEPMAELVANTTDASQEKHVPVVTMDDNMIHVEVGSVLHPMEDAHYINFIYVETEKGGMKKALKPGDEPKADFCLLGDKAVAVYEYCNLHGLWKTEL